MKSFAEDADLSIRTGRFGPYLKYKTDNYKLPKDVDPTSMSYEDCMKLIAETPAKTARKGVARKSSPRAKKSKS